MDPSGHFYLGVCLLIRNVYIFRRLTGSQRTPWIWGVTCKAAGDIVEAKFRHIFWTPCVVHTLNLALKNICAPSTHPRYDDVMEQCGWISRVSSDASFIKNFIMNHAMRLSMYNNHCKLKLLSVGDTCFASTIVMLKRFKTIKRGLEQLVISEE